jgi:hypothetical protein
MKNVRAAALLAGALLAGCGDHQPSSPEPVSGPMNPPDLSAPQRFRPYLTSVAVSSSTVRVGDVAVVTAELHPIPGTRAEWIVLAEDTSRGNGVVEPRSGVGDVRTEFRANYRGEVTLFLYAVDSRGVPAVPQRVHLTVVP